LRLIYCRRLSDVHALRGDCGDDCGAGKAKARHVTFAIHFHTSASIGNDTFLSIQVHLANRPSKQYITKLRQHGE
jgi:hypothetical protein